MSAQGALRRRSLWALLAATLVAVAVTAVMSRRWSGPARAPEILGTVPDFALTNRDRRTIGPGDLAGRPWVAAFVFTRCGGVCPRITEQMMRLARLLPHPERLRRVSFTVDPDYDTPEVLARYAADHGITDPEWYFLTTDRPPEIYRLAREGFRLAVEPDPPAGTASPEEPILHSTRLVLVDGHGRVRGYYDAFEEEGIGRLLGDVEAVLRER